MSNEKPKKPITIFDVDVELYRRAKAQAILEGKKIGEWLGEAIELKLNKGDK